MALTWSENAIKSFVDFDEAAPFGVLQCNRLVGQPRRRRFDRDESQIDWHRVDSDFARQQAGKVLQVSPVRRHTQRPNDIVKELFHRKHVQIEPIASDGMLRLHVFTRSCIAIRVARRTYIQVVQISGNCWAQSLPIAPKKQKQNTLFSRANNFIKIWRVIPQFRAMPKHLTLQRIKLTRHFSLCFLALRRFIWFALRSYAFHPQ